MGGLTDRRQLKFSYGHYHQQPQQHSHYDELDPFRRSVREPSKHFVEATHGQPPQSNRLPERSLFQLNQLLIEVSISQPIPDQTRIWQSSSAATERQR